MMRLKMFKKMLLIFVILAFGLLFSTEKVESSHSPDYPQQHSKGIQVKLDYDDPQLWEFKFISSSDSCYINLIEEDGGFGGDETGSARGSSGKIISHLRGSLSDGVSVNNCQNKNGDDDTCDVLNKLWGGVDDHCDGDNCYLAVDERNYKPKWDMLCIADEWYVCENSGRTFNFGGSEYLCNANLEWVPVPATVTITTPTPNQVFTGTTEVTLQATTNKNANCRWSFTDQSYSLMQVGSFSTTGARSHSATITPLTNQPYTVHVRCDAGGITNPTSQSVTFSVSATSADTTPPVRSAARVNINLLNNTMLPSGTTSTSISLTTNEAAICRYSATAGTAYSSMTMTFTTQSPPATAHSATISGLTSGTNYKYYIRCQDTAAVPNTNTDDYIINFSVDTPANVDTTPPDITITSPTSNQIFLSGTRQVTLSATTNEAATCRWSTTDQLYSDMPSANTLSGGGTASHSTTLTGLSDNQPYTRYVRCQDTTGNPTTTSQVARFSVAGTLKYSPDGARSGTC